MYRKSSGYPDYTGPVDDFSLQDTILKPQIEQYTEDRGKWLDAITDVPQARKSSAEMAATL